MIDRGIEPSFIGLYGFKHQNYDVVPSHHYWMHQETSVDSYFMGILQSVTEISCNRKPVYIYISIYI